ncbi:ion transport protein [Holotrichia oblita]|uniref:Ion transport protein n=2 Tax=Holotrichia oblita TaxID=644536 RepID=A0ACB9TLR5_HOLOL|nr:ion transport protein [Holotrichia oblita]KAI4467782.1 ion transport protein [Holotrichia oblita]
MNIIEMPSNRNSQAPRGHDEPQQLWSEESIMDNGDSVSSESGEDDSGSECEMSVLCRVNQEIWEESSIWDELHDLHGAEDIFELLQNENLENIEDYKYYGKAGLLISCWQGKDKFTKYFLERAVDPNCADNIGRTPLHFAAASGALECVKLLIEYGANVSKWDREFKATPLHCAASKGHLCCLKYLLRNGADVNAGLAQKSALHYAVQSEALECVKELLEAGAVPNTPQVFSEAPIHVAASIGAFDILKLLINHGASVRVQCGTEKSTALHLAAADGDVECVKILLDAGADINARNHKNQTALHMAALSQSTEILEVLLKRGADPNAADINGRTPLHGAIVKFSRACEPGKLLLNAGANVNKPDVYGYTPLHLAALNEFSQSVMLLLSYGGDMTAKTNGGISVLTFITRRTPDVIPKFIGKLDSSIKLNDHEIGDVDCELKLDFRVLVPSVVKGETDLLLNFIEVGHREILQHPLCETFLFLKWRRIRKFFLFSLFYHSLFALLFTTYIQGLFLTNDNSTSSRNTTAKLEVDYNPCTIPWYIIVSGYSMFILNCMLMAKEIFQIAHSWFSYIKQWENWLQWLIILSVFCCVYRHNPDVRCNIATWQHHVAAIGIFLTWLELLMIVGRFPIFGIYIQMFTTVALNFFKFLMAYMCLLIAFSLSFGVLLSKYKSFNDPKWTMLKTIIMMSGELEYEDVFFDDNTDIIYPYTAHIMYLAFALLVTIILSNLMVGLAVSDIQELQRSAGLDRLVRQAELVAHLESMLFSRLLYCVPHRLLTFFHRHALLLRSQHYWALYIKPNDPRETKIPRNIIDNIYKLVVERKPRRKRRSDKGLRRGDSVSRMNSNVSAISVEKV